MQSQRSGDLTRARQRAKLSSTSESYTRGGVREAGTQEGDETPVGQLANDLGNLVAQWEELGIDPDDFLKCAQCHKFMRELVEGTEPVLTEDELCHCP